MVVMVLEHAVLDVRAGASRDFEAAFAVAKPILTSAPGFRSLRLSRCVEHPDRYLLLVEWVSVADHEEGFRGSPAYQEWRRLLHGFYPSFPVVQHYETVLEG
jgi:heme-degrading monooxygenase HmoA